MSLESTSQFMAAVKQEYLPPPLETNYLSLLDIQARMAQDSLQGTEEQKIAIIKKRIKKFFGYGNDGPQVDVDLTQDSTQKQAKHPQTEFNQATMIGLQIFASQLIVYGKEKLTLENAAKLFPDFVSSEKIDDCNLKLIFTTDSDLKKLLKAKSKDREWFEVELKLKNGEGSGIVFYVRYASNKDDLLFENDKYFRKLLGKARHMLQKQQLNEERREVEERVKAERRALINERKKFSVKRDRYNEKHQKDFDEVTNYDGVYSTGGNHKNERSRENSFDRTFDEAEHMYPGERGWKREKKDFEDLNVSEIHEKGFYEKKKYEYNGKRGYREGNSRDSIDFKPMGGEKRRVDLERNGMVMRRDPRVTEGGRYGRRQRSWDSLELSRDSRR